MLLHRPHTREPGQALVEFALTIPLFLLFVFGIIDLARVLFAYAHTVDASRQAVRHGIVTGLDADTIQYLDCQGIYQKALDQLAFSGLENVQVDISYEDTQGNFLTNCESDLTRWDVNDDDVLVVEVRGNLAPLMPLFRVFDDQLDLSYSSRRTINAEGVAFTSQWVVPPEAAKNFTATVDCAATTNNVSFDWNTMAIPDRAVIMDAFTNQVVVELNDVPPHLVTNAFCDNCASIGPGQQAMYYLVAYTGEPPNEQAGPPSNEAYVYCDEDGGGGGEGGGVTMPVGTGVVDGFVWEDSDQDGVKDNPEKGESDVAVTLRWAGPDGLLHTDDDQVFSAMTDNQGEFTFSNLPAASFEVTVTVPPGWAVTTGTTPYSFFLNDGYVLDYVLGIVASS